MSRFRERRGTVDGLDKPRAFPSRPAGGSCSWCLERGRPFLRIRYRQGAVDSLDKPRACPFRPSGGGPSQRLERGRPLLRIPYRQGAGNGLDKPRACPSRPAGAACSRCLERGPPLVGIRCREACAKRAQISVTLLGFGGRTGRPEENQACSRQSKEHWEPSPQDRKCLVIGMTGRLELVCPPPAFKLPQAG
jgi:hypothetical protein